MMLINIHIERDQTNTVKVMIKSIFLEDSEVISGSSDDDWTS